MTDFEWDPKKAFRNVEKQGVRFEEAKRIFEGVRLTLIDHRRDYREMRWRSVGEGGAASVLFVAFTRREGVIRLISARRANQKERERYYEYCAKKEIEDGAGSEKPSN